MAATVETQECFPKPIKLGDLELPAPPARHAECQGKHTLEGIMGGWVCPCECHQKPRTDHAAEVMWTEEGPVCKRCLQPVNVSVTHKW